MGVYELVLESEKLLALSKAADEAADEAISELENMLNISVWENSKGFFWQEKKGDKYSQYFPTLSAAIKAHIDGKLEFKKRG